MKGKNHLPAEIRLLGSHTDLCPKTKKQRAPWSWERFLTQIPE